MAEGKYRVSVRQSEKLVENIYYLILWNSLTNWHLCLNFFSDYLRIIIILKCKCHILLLELEEGHMHARSVIKATHQSMHCSHTVENATGW